VVLEDLVECLIMCQLAVDPATHDHLSGVGGLQALDPDGRHGLPQRLGALRNQCIPHGGWDNDRFPPG
jgi:hypothetical protein